MGSRSNRGAVHFAAWIVFLIGLVVAGCRFVIPQQEWSEKKWGPLVPHAKFPGDCSLCHVPERWDKLRDDFSFDHEKETGYKLEGAHADAACLRCHNDRGPVEVYVARGCAGCHVDPHASTMGLDCERCHTQTSWEPTGLIAEHARTRFPLMGAHAIAACDSCHEGAPAGDFRGAPVQCEFCHRDDAVRVTDPDHVANGWVNNCDRCHNPIGWNAANFEHTFFPLTGGHGGLECTDCHAPGTFTGLSPDCYSCHEADYQTAPDHVAQNYSHDCQQCHGKSAWLPAVIDHSFFPLKGGHSGLSCSQCHAGGTFTGLSPDCYSCHDSDYQSAPDHATFGFPHDCTECHTISAWTPSSFSHDFPLRNSHNVSCETCHTTGTTATFSCLDSCHAKSTTDSHHSEVRNYTYTSSACYSCHPNGRGGD